jgi:putative addiction module component (TIGR02574 family)
MLEREKGFEPSTSTLARLLVAHAFRWFATLAVQDGAARSNSVVGIGGERFWLVTRQQLRASDDTSRRLQHGCYARCVAATKMLEEILRLPVEERAKLALELLRTLDGESETGAAEAWDAEIERRGAEVDAGTADSMSLDEYRAHVRKRRLARAGR